MFTKPALAIDQPIDLLIRRGMEIPHRNFAQQHLSHVNYYRLSAYWLPFEIQTPMTADHQFISGTTFEKEIYL